MVIEPHTQNTDWCAIMAGTVLALAISLVLLNFGSAVGLADALDLAADDITAAKVLGIGIWLLWVQLLASLIGGYVAGRLRTPVPGASEHEREVRDGLHGVVVWAAGTVLVAVGVALAAAFGAIAAAQTGNAGEAEATITEAAQQLEETTAIIFAFCTAASSLISAVVSWWAATTGGDHRDSGVDLSRYLSFRRA